MTKLCDHIDSFFKDRFPGARGDYILHEKLQAVRVANYAEDVGKVRLGLKIALTLALGGIRICTDSDNFVEVPLNGRINRGQEEADLVVSRMCCSFGVSCL